MKRKTILILLTFALVLEPLMPLGNQVSGQSVSTATSSGSFLAGLKDDDGVSNYTILYSYPRSVTAGSNLIVTATLEVNTMSGLKLYLRHYRFDAFVFVSSTLVSRATNASDPFASPLYAGSHWGPIELIMPINSTSAGIRPGEVLQANVTLSLLGDVYHDVPKSNFVSESGRSTIGTVNIIGPSGQPAINLGESAAAGIAVLVVIVIIIAAYAVGRRVTKRRTGGIN